MITGMLAAVVVLGFLIVVHEFGHFIVAKRSGVGVLKFSVGFGPRLFGRAVNGTEYVAQRHPARRLRQDGRRGSRRRAEAGRSAISFSHQRCGSASRSSWRGRCSTCSSPSSPSRSCSPSTAQRVPSDVAEGGRRHDGHAGGARRACRPATSSPPSTGSRSPTGTSCRRPSAPAAARRSTLTRAARWRSRRRSTVTPEAKPDKNIFGEVVGTGVRHRHRARLRSGARRSVRGDRRWAPSRRSGGCRRCS